jgi:hypothetical protein
VQNKQRYQELNRQEGGADPDPNMKIYIRVSLGGKQKNSDAQNNKTDKTYKVFLSHIMPPFYGVHDMRIQKTYEEPMNKL